MNAPQRKHLRPTFAFIFLLLSSYATCALAATGPKDDTSTGDWQINLGAFATYRPEYSGSNDSKARMLPNISATYRDWIYMSPIQGVGIKLLNNSTAQLSLGIGYGGGRNNDGNLSPLRSESGGALLKSNGDIRYGLLKATLSTSYGLSGDAVGSDIEAGIGFIIPIQQSIFARVTHTARWESSQRSQANYGLNPSQASLLGLPSYQSNSGINARFNTLAVNWVINPQWVVGGNYQRGKLIGDAAHSPIVQILGTPRQSSSSIYLSYRWL